MLHFGNQYRTEVAVAQPRPVISARRALDVLGAFSAERPEWSVTEMSQHLGVHKSTMSRLLSTMEAAGFVRRAPNNGHYALGPRLLEMAALVLSRLDVRTVARPWRQELSWIRECGYAIAEDEFQDGVTAVAAAILTRGLAAGVVSIPAPTYRTTRQRKGQFVQLLTTAAREIGQRMEIAPVWTSTSRQ